MKKYRLISMMVMLGLCQICSATLVNYWNFDNSGDLGNDSEGSFDLTAKSGFSAPVYDAGGKIGGAAYFDGTNSSYITATGIYSSPSFTFAAWVKASDTNVNALVTPLSGRGGFQVYASGGNWRGRVNKQNNTFAYRILGPVVADEWSHLAITFSATSGPDVYTNYTGAFRVYLDGVYIGGYTSTNYCPNPTYTMTMGANSLTQFFTGLVDDVRIYDTALSGTAIADLAAMPEPTTISLLSVSVAGLLIGRRVLNKK